MNIHIPPAIASMGPQLQEFFELMVAKLNANSHKDAIRSDDIDGLLEKLADEVQEFRDQRIQDSDDPNMLEELADTGNFAFLLFLFLRSRGLKDARERFIDEYFDIDPELGIVRCRKTRAGSPYKPGQRVWGSMRNGVRVIRVQNGTAAFTVTLRDLVWWKWNGKWPERPLRYRGLRTTINESVDRIENLIETEPERARLPFVSQWKPRGRENSQNYGKWRYSRRYRHALIVCGYWDTPQEAAELGLKAWKEKVKNV